jgi:heptosyltransferase-2
MGPYKTKHNNFEVENLSCRPCSKLGSQSCPKSHFKCMMDQPLEEISNKIQESLEKG